MAQAAQPVGLALALNWGDGGVLMENDKLIAAALTMAGGPLVSIAYRARGIPLGRLAAAAAAPVAYSVYTSSFSASALAPAVDISDNVQDTGKALPELKSILSLYRPLSLAMMLAKNLGMHLLMKFQRYMVDVANHEQAAIAAEAQGQEVPPEPPFPDFAPAVQKGLYAFGRDLAVSTTRRVYEHVTAARLPPSRAKALLRDSRSWIRDVLSAKHRSSPLTRRFVAYQFAALHSSVLFYAADCTVSIAQHTYRTAKRKELGARRQAAYWARGVVLQVVRCGLIWAVASVGASLGSLVRPGLGTQFGGLATEIAAAVVMGHVVETLLE